MMVLMLGEPLGEREHGFRHDPARTRDPCRSRPVTRRERLEK
jgi:hypothetical protein